MHLCYLTFNVDLDRLRDNVIDTMPTEVILGRLPSLKNTRLYGLIRLVGTAGSGKDRDV